jgi:hypothetical protein
MAVTRRRFIHLVGRHAGATALYSTFDAMGLLASPAHSRVSLALPRNSAGHRIVVLGAGIAGMAAA